MSFRTNYYLKWSDSNDPDANLALLVKLNNDVEFNYPKFELREWHRGSDDFCFVCLTPFCYVMFPSSSLPGYHRYTDSVYALVYHPVERLSYVKHLHACCLFSNISKYLKFSHSVFKCLNGELIYFLVHVTRRIQRKRYSSSKKSEFFSLNLAHYPWQYVCSFEWAFICLC